MKSSKEIEALIEKYWDGETSLEEETQLQFFFQGEVIPDHLKTYQAQFKDLATRKEVSWEGFSEDKLFGKLESEVNEAPEIKVVSMKPNNGQVWFWRAAAAVALIMVGYFAGQGFKSDNELSEIQKEMAILKEMMIEKVEGRSASGRLQAVNYSLEMQTADDETLNVLIKVLQEDDNMIVRTKAVEALAKFGSNPLARTALVDALGGEEEPAVQIALIEALVQLKAMEALDGLQDIVDSENYLREVKDEAHMGMFKLREL